MTDGKAPSSLEIIPNNIILSLKKITDTMRKLQEPKDKG